ncbi:MULTISPECIES: glycine betaine ABC transporter substrate-binding protein [Mesorhizobium]|uniref:Glycine betaine/proline transport system substrate-binding protein n=1 Tax=Rhizobium loti TaxID=381 RepID=A0A8E2W7T0_RHILI|nr:MULTISPECIES: glycine betaine ABC transporter substrate-binding protein [Mesorhizobium]PWJ88163.1 glycine betaine/proline transport system substrate-binding protein [Mesorhizobium loti]QKC86862.1 amino acid-binding protein [Mesorhizobium sp. NZP2077]QKD20567.1 amino acid-binding protein [Mesorhizobium sp. NZP2077]
MKIKLSMLALAVAMGLAAPAAAQEKIKIGSSNWPSLQAMSSVLKEITEKYFGASAEVVNSTLPIIMASMDKGEIDILPEIWSPNHDSLINTYVKEKQTVKLGSLTFPSISGMCTTRHTQEKFGVKSIYDLSRPEIADVFRSAAGGKPKLWVGPAGWSSSKTELIRARDYGYADLFELTTVEESLAIVDLEQAIRADTPWIGICYTPHPTFSRKEVVMLDEPPHDPAKWKIVQPDQNPNWLAMSSSTTAWAPISVNIAYAKELEAKDPKLVALLNNITLDPAEIAQWIDAVGTKKIDPDTFAKDWVSKNDAKILGWMAGKAQ